ncbi:MAG: HEAT repeat domain-containing protein [Anaeromyxobacteraceae bacterium]
MAAKTFDPSPVVRARLDDPDPVVRTLIAKGAAKALSWAELEPLVEPMLASTTPAARYSALDILWTHRRTGAKEVLERSLADSHSHVRGTARWLLKGEAGFDAATAQRAALSKASNADLVGALEGLGEVGDATDAARALPYLGHPRARVRAAAIHLLGAVGGAEHREALIGALSDPSAKVSRAARMLLLRAGAIDPDRITWAAHRSSHPHERKGAVDLARAHDHWLAGVLLLRIATRTTDAAVVGRASEALQSWENRYNRVFSAPSEALVAEFEALVSRESAIEPAQLTRLRGLVPALRTRLRGT